MIKDRTARHQRDGTIAYSHSGSRAVGCMDRRHEHSRFETASSSQHCSSCSADGPENRKLSAPLSLTCVCRDKFLLHAVQRPAPVEQKVPAVEPERRQGRAPGHERVAQRGKLGHSSARGERAALVLEAPGKGEQAQPLRKSRDIPQLGEELCGL
ncbi:hypothetical protein B0H14DRAFT_2739526 [Mycena olivaceomarginata]|nr:hypothetical protein B0H14DRAFT_2739526 [Mycena olivaceomarginata]